MKKPKKTLAKWAYFIYNNSARKFSVVSNHTPGDLSLSCFKQRELEPQQVFRHPLSPML